MCSKIRVWAFISFAVFVAAMGSTQATLAVETFVAGAAIYQSYYKVDTVPELSCSVTDNIYGFGPVYQASASFSAIASAGYGSLHALSPATASLPAALVHSVNRVEHFQAVADASAGWYDTITLGGAPLGTKITMEFALEFT